MDIGRGATPVEIRTDNRTPKGWQIFSWCYSVTPSGFRFWWGVCCTGVSLRCPPACILVSPSGTTHIPHIIQSHFSNTIYHRSMTMLCGRESQGDNNMSTKRGLHTILMQASFIFKRIEAPPFLIIFNYSKNFKIQRSSSVAWRMLLYLAGRPDTIIVAIPDLKDIS